MKNYLEIKPNEGLGDFKFGTDINEIIAVLGEPDETEILNDEDFETKIISFWEKGFTFFFEGEDYTIFTCVEADNDDITLYGKKIIGKDEKSIIKLMTDKGYSEMETEEEEWGEKRLTFEECAIDFYFEDGRLVSVSWASLDIEEGEEE